MVGTTRTDRACFTIFLFVLIIIKFFAQAGGRVGVARRIARRTIGTARGTIGVGGFSKFNQIGVDAAFFARRFAFAVLVLAGRARRTILAHVQIEFAQITFRTRTGSTCWCFFSLCTPSTMWLVCFTLCIPTGAFGAHFNTIDIIFKFARRAIGTLGAACFGGTAGSTLVAWTLSIFVRGKRIFRAKMAFLGTSDIVEFTLQIEQETKSTIHATTRKELRIVVNPVLVRKAQRNQC